MLFCKDHRRAICPPVVSSCRDRGRRRRASARAGALSGRVVDVARLSLADRARLVAARANLRTAARARRLAKREGTKGARKGQVAIGCSSARTPRRAAPRRARARARARGRCRRRRARHARRGRPRLHDAAARARAPRGRARHGAGDAAGAKPDKAGSTARRHPRGMISCVPIFAATAARRAGARRGGGGAVREATRRPAAAGRWSNSTRTRPILAVMPGDCRRSLPRCARRSDDGGRGPAALFDDDFSAARPRPPRRPRRERWRAELVVVVRRRGPRRRPCDVAAAPDTSPGNDILVRPIRTHATLRRAPPAGAGATPPARSRRRDRHHACGRCEALHAERARARARPPRPRALAAASSTAPTREDTDGRRGDSGRALRGRAAAASAKPHASRWPKKAARCRPAARRAPWPPPAKVCAKKDGKRQGGCISRRTSVREPRGLPSMSIRAYQISAPQRRVSIARVLPPLILPVRGDERRRSSAARKPLRAARPRARFSRGARPLWRGSCTSAVARAARHRLQTASSRLRAPRRRRAMSPFDPPFDPTLDPLDRRPRRAARARDNETSGAAPRAIPVLWLRDPGRRPRPQCRVRATVLARGALARGEVPASRSHGAPAACARHRRAEIGERARPASTIYSASRLRLRDGRGSTPVRCARRCSTRPTRPRSSPRSAATTIDAVDAPRAGSSFAPNFDDRQHTRTTCCSRACSLRREERHRSRSSIALAGGAPRTTRRARRRAARARGHPRAAEPPRTYVSPARGVPHSLRAARATVAPREPTSSCSTSRASWEGVSSSARGGTATSPRRRLLPRARSPFDDAGRALHHASPDEAQLSAHHRQRSPLAALRRTARAPRRSACGQPMIRPRRATKAHPAPPALAAAAPRRACRRACTPDAAPRDPRRSCRASRRHARARLCAWSGGRPSRGRRPTLRAGRGARATLGGPRTTRGDSGDRRRAARRIEACYGSLPSPSCTVTAVEAQA